MRLTSRKAKRGNGVLLDLTSMIDVVFLLLIFFMVNASFRATERSLDSGIQDAKNRSGKKSPLEPVIVEFEKAADRHYYKLGTRRVADASELQSLLRKFDNKSDGAFVRVVDHAPFDMVASAIQACRDAGFISVSYVADSSAPSP